MRQGASFKRRKAVVHRRCHPWRMVNRTDLISKLRRAGFDPSQILVMLALRDQLEGCQSVLDIDFGPDSPRQHFGFGSLVGLDGWEPSLDKNQPSRPFQLDARFCTMLCSRYVQHNSKHEATLR